MFEVFLGYITDIADFINSIIDTIKGLVASLTGKEQETTTIQSDEDALLAKSMYNG